MQKCQCSFPLKRHKFSWAPLVFPRSRQQLEPPPPPPPLPGMPETNNGRSHAGLGGGVWVGGGVQHPPFRPQQTRRCLRRVFIVSSLKGKHTNRRRRFGASSHLFFSERGERKRLRGRCSKQTDPAGTMERFISPQCNLGNHEQIGRSV